MARKKNPQANGNPEAKPKRRGRPAKAKQEYLPDMAPPSIPEVERAEMLRALMHQHNLKVYEFDGKKVELTLLEKVKVNRQKSEEGG